MVTNFYLPRRYLPSEEERTSWFTGGKQTLREGGKEASAQAWIYRTWLELSRFNCPVELVHELPFKGCAVALSGTLPLDYRPPEKLFLVAVAADGIPHPAAHLHILQNQAHALRLPRSVFMPHWPQPGLLARDPDRIERFERAVFFGTRENLAPELQGSAWSVEVKKQTGLAFELRGPESWHDYSDVDVVIAVRTFGNGRLLHKPATKLYNAWLAGAPFIGGRDSAYRYEGVPGQDYLVAKSPKQLLAHLCTLKSNPDFCRALVEAGRAKSRSRTRQAIAERWRMLIDETLPAKAESRLGTSHKINAGTDTFMRTIYKLDRFFRD